MFIKKKIINIYSNKIRRYDLDKAFHYFDYSTYTGLKKTDFSFKSNTNTLNGCFFYYEMYNKDELIIFTHGLDSGYIAYMPEIERLARMGYRVLAYDNTGCVSSSGKSIRGLSQSLADLDNAINHLRSLTEFKTMPISVIGHSWGAYAALNIREYQSNIKSIVSLAGFISISNLCNQYVPFILRPLKHIVLGLEKEVNSKYYKANALNSLDHDDTKFLIIHSKDDETVSFKYNANYLFKHCQKPNVKYLFVQGKNHGPQYSKEAIRYSNQVLKKYRYLVSSGKLKTEEERITYMKNTDFKKLSLLDEYIWKEIENTLKNKGE